jgi:hypothetical protein
VEAKGIFVGDAQTRDLITKTVLNSLRRATDAIARVKLARGIAWQAL